MDDKQITEVTRRAIIDHFELGNVYWSGRLNDQEFLAPLRSSQPSINRSAFQRRSRRHLPAYSQQLRLEFGCGVFYDPRFDLLHGPDDAFLRFLCETVNPIVRPGETSTPTLELVALYNTHLAADGWTLVQAARGLRQADLHTGGRRPGCGVRGAHRLDQGRSPTSGSPAAIGAGGQRRALAGRRAPLSRSPHHRRLEVSIRRVIRSLTMQLRATPTLGACWKRSSDSSCADPKTTRLESEVASSVRLASVSLGVASSMSG